MDLPVTELEKKVWERVNGGAERTHCPTLMDQEAEAAAVCRYLAAHSGAHRARFLKMEQESLENIRTLRGIWKLSGEEHYEHAAYQPQKENYRHLLAHACRDCQKLVQQYEAHAEIGPFACVFRELARKKTLCLESLLQMIG